MIVFDLNTNDAEACSDTLKNSGPNQAMLVRILDC